VAHARATTGVDVRVLALVRDASRLYGRLPWAATAPWLELVTGDVRSFALPSGDVNFVVHVANTGSPAEGKAGPEAAAAMVVDGSLRVHELASAAGATRMLQMSSGSVYGAHAVPAAPIEEGDPGEPELGNPAQRLARAKRDAEERLLAAASS